MDASARTPRRPARAEVVGSLLRPPELRRLFAEIYAGKDRQITTFVEPEHAEQLAHLGALAEEAISAAVRR